MLMVSKGECGYVAGCVDVASRLCVDYNKCPIKAAYGALKLACEYDDLEDALRKYARSFATEAMERLGWRERLTWSPVTKD